MKFLVDKCTGPSVAKWLRSEGHKVFSVFDKSRGMSDDAILEKAYVEDRILITNDKDFGEMVYRDSRRHHGVIFLRLRSQRSAVKIRVLAQLLSIYADRITNTFVVATETQVRFTTDE